MIRYCFSVASGTPVLLTDEQVRSRISQYASEDPGLRYLSRFGYTLDRDDLDVINLAATERYKDPATVSKFFSQATAQAAGFANTFAKLPRYRILYVCIEVSEDQYELSVLQDRHPRAIDGTKEYEQVPVLGGTPGLPREKLVRHIKDGLAEVKSHVTRAVEARKATEKRAGLTVNADGGIDL